jgi:hypothetical protein
MTREECIRTRNHREMILHPEWWYFAAFLPVERKLTTGEMQPGYIMNPRHANMFPLSRVFIGNIYNMQDTDPWIDYETVDQVLADGWIVS